MATGHGLPLDMARASIINWRSRRLLLKTIGVGGQTSRTTTSRVWADLVLVTITSHITQCIVVTKTYSLLLVH